MDENGEGWLDGGKEGELNKQMKKEGWRKEGREKGGRKEACGETLVCTE